MNKSCPEEALRSLNFLELLALRLGSEFIASSPFNGHSSSPEGFLAKPTSIFKKRPSFINFMAKLFMIAAFITTCASVDAWAGTKVIRIAATGDIMMGTENNLPDDAGAAAFSEVRSFIKDRQVVIGNLEGPLTERGAPSKIPVAGISYVFRTPPSYVQHLKEAGFTIMSLANNHANDYGPEGYAQTVEVLQGAGILHTGGPGQWARQHIGRTTVSVLALAPNNACQDINDIPAVVDLVKEEAAKDNTIIIIVFHGGGEGEGYIYVPQGPEIFLGERRGDLRALGRALIDAGAHAVIGHGPHVPRGMELYKNRLIAYSLGNFVTGKGISISGKNGLAPLLLLDFDEKATLLEGRVISFKQRDSGKASLDHNNEALSLMHALSLYDFESPALKADGSIVISDNEAKLLAANSPRPPRPRASAPKRAASTAVAADLKDRAKSSSKSTGEKPFKYEWDSYSKPSTPRR